MIKETISNTIKRTVTRAYNGHCAYCSNKATHFDHIYPESKGGKTELFNIMPLCEHHNTAKGVQIPNAGMFEYHKMRLRTLGIWIPPAYIVGNPYVNFSSPLEAKKELCEGFTIPELGCKVHVRGETFTLRQFLVFVEDSKNWPFATVKNLLKAIILCLRRDYKQRITVWNKLVSSTGKTEAQVRAKLIQLGLYEDGKFTLEVI